MEEPVQEVGQVKQTITLEQLEEAQNKKIQKFTVRDLKEIIKQYQIIDLVELEKTRPKKADLRELVLKYVGSSP